MKKLAECHSLPSPRFGSAQKHCYLLDFLKSVAQCYHQDGRAEDLVVDLLKLKVPKLFAVEGEGEDDEKVRCEFSAFLQKHILKYYCKHVHEKMSKILVSVFANGLKTVNSNVHFVKSHLVNIDQMGIDKVGSFPI